jgi:hypothetical protein
VLWAPVCDFGSERATAAFVKATGRPPAPFHPTQVRLQTNPVHKLRSQTQTAPLLSSRTRRRPGTGLLRLHPSLSPSLPLSLSHSLTLSLSHSAAPRHRAAAVASFALSLSLSLTLSLSLSLSLGGAPAQGCCGCILRASFTKHSRKAGSYDFVKNVADEMKHAPAGWKRVRTYKSIAELMDHLNR